jgi:FixJ family two-component response regulator
MREGAVDFLVKPVDEPELLGAVFRAVAKDGERLLADRAQHDLEERRALLTGREREVYTLVVRGRLNKQIAYELGIRVDSVAALVRLSELQALSLKP